jgi:hypothetical protein
MFKFPHKKGIFDVYIRGVPPVGVGGCNTPNVVILQFCRAILATLTTRSSSKKYLIQQNFAYIIIIVGKIIIVRKILINLRKYYYCTNFDMLVKNRYATRTCICEKRN